MLQSFRVEEILSQQGITTPSKIPYMSGAEEVICGNHGFYTGQHCG